MTRKWPLVVTLLHLSCFTPALGTAENMSFGVGATGNFFLIEGHPQLDPGIGGHVYFDYRFAQHLSAQFLFGVEMQDGSGPNAGDGDIIFFTMPSVLLKYYFLPSAGRIDPFAAIGIGLHLTSEGSRGDGTKAFGFGATAGLGLDCYFTPALSAYAVGTFNSIGMIDSFGSNNGKGLFPVTARGGLAFHF
ncbi:MAG: hypothetical protein HYV02_04360 [Deltaproteobacteria bacterium]|nr:hypothetical protein [Deltaproteobacteria bacterium]